MWGEDNLTFDFENALNYYHYDASRNLRCAAVMMRLFLMIFFHEVPMCSQRCSEAPAHRQLECKVAQTLQIELKVSPVRVPTNCIQGVCGTEVGQESSRDLRL